MKMKNENIKLFIISDFFNNEQVVNKPFWL